MRSTRASSSEEDSGRNGGDSVPTTSSPGSLRTLRRARSKSTPPDGDHRLTKRSRPPMTCSRRRSYRSRAVSPRMAALRSCTGPGAKAMGSRHGGLREGSQQVSRQFTRVAAEQFRVRRLLDAVRGTDARPPQSRASERYAAVRRAADRAQSSSSAAIRPAVRSAIDAARAGSRRMLAIARASPSAVGSSA